MSRCWQITKCRNGPCSFIDTQLSCYSVNFISPIVYYPSSNQIYHISIIVDVVSASMKSSALRHGIQVFMLTVISISNNFV